MLVLGLRLRMKSVPILAHFRFRQAQFGAPRDRLHRPSSVWVNLSLASYLVVDNLESIQATGLTLTRLSKKLCRLFTMWWRRAMFAILEWVLAMPTSVRCIILFDMLCAYWQHMNSFSPCHAKYVSPSGSNRPSLNSSFPWSDYAINNKLTPFISMQNHYNLLYREEEREMFPTLKVAKQPLSLI